MALTTDDKRRDPLVGRVIAGKFEVRELLGVGAMGKVYKAHHAALDKVVAVKVLHAGQTAADPTLAQRFKAEARAASRLDHPNSVQILDFGEDGGDQLLYIAMELLQGQSLGDLLKRVGRLSALRASTIMMQVLAALAAAHRSGVVHRDLKPANIMLVKKTGDDGELSDFVKVCDFGIAKVMDAAGPDEATAAMTKQGAIFGTPAYMSPEQARGEKVDLRTDLYSCGVLLYRMVSGRLPYQAETAMGLLTKLMTERPVPLSQLVSTVDPRLEALVARAMAKERNERWSSAIEMRSALKDLLGGDGVLSATQPPPSSAVAARPTSSPPQGEIHDTARVPSALPAAPFQTMSGAAFNRTGTWTGTGVARSVEAPSASPPRTKLYVGIALVLAALAGGGLLVAKSVGRRGAITDLVDATHAGSFGVAENLFNEHFDDLKRNEGALTLIPEILRQRRESESFESRLAVKFDPTFTLRPSSWIGTYTAHDSKRPMRFICVIETVDGPTFEGYLDWPDAGVRAALHGIVDGNHLVFWDHKILAGSGPEVKRYVLNDKKNVFLEADKLAGIDGPFSARLDAKLQR